MKLSTILLEDDRLLLENQIAKMADEIGDVLDQKLSDEDKKKLQNLDNETNEALLTAALMGAIALIGKVLTVAAIVQIVAKFGAELIEHFAGKETQISSALKKAYEYVHHKEEMFITYLGEKSIGRFTKNKNIIKIVGAVLFIVLVGGLGAIAGIGALKAAQSAKYGTAALKAGKVLLKGKDIVGASKMVRAAVIPLVAPDIGNAIKGVKIT